MVEANKNQFTKYIDWRLTDLLVSLLRLHSTVMRMCSVVVCRFTAAAHVRSLPSPQSVPALRAGLPTGSMVSVDPPYPPYLVFSLSEDAGKKLGFGFLYNY